MARSHPHPPTAASPRALLFGYAPLAVAAAALPPLVPPSVPELRGPVWLAVVMVTAGLGLAVSVARRPPRWALLVAGWALVALTTVQAFVVGDLVALLGFWLAVPALAVLAGQLRRRARRALVATHAISSACWVGVAAVMVAMSVVALTTRDAGTMLVTYRLMEVFDITLLPWANFAATMTGIALGLTTKWGLLRHYWVAAKLTISILVLVMAFGFLHDALTGAYEDAERLTNSTAGDLGSLPLVVLGGFAFAFLNLVAAMVLSLYKPWGRTPRAVAQPQP